MPQRDTDRNLLFGMLALQMEFLDRGELLAALKAWTIDRHRPLDALLADRRLLDPAQVHSLRLMLDCHLAKHEGDPRASLASLGSTRGVVQEIRRSIDDHRIIASLAHVIPSQSEDPYATRPEVAPNTTLVEADCYATKVPSSPVSPVPSASPSGTRYRKVRNHAQGGLGVVFVAREDELNREVALKEIQDRYADDPVSRARFMLEAEVTGGLEHPGVVPIYGLGCYEDGRPFYAMRFIRGISLKEAIVGFHSDEALRADPGARQLALRKLLRRFLDVCNAVEYAHSRGVLHRDLKPANVMLGRYGETLVVDWGLAKVRGRVAARPSEESPLILNSAGSSAETRPGAAIGTPAFMSPEQAGGQLEKLGPASDVYSLGATLYCVLVGGPPPAMPMPAASPRTSSGGSWLRATDPTTDTALLAVASKAMASSPEERYDSAGGLAEDLERWLAGEAVSAWSEPWPLRARRWLGRHQTSLAAFAASFVVALLGLSATLVVQTEKSRAQAAANLSLRDAYARIRTANANLAVANEESRTANASLSAALERVRIANSAAQSRFRLALEAVDAFSRTASRNEQLKQPNLLALRMELIKVPLDFYKKLGSSLEQGSDADPESRLALGGSYLVLAELSEGVGSRSDALDALEHDRDLSEAMIREQPGPSVYRSHLVETYQWLARIQRDLGQIDQASGSIERVLELLGQLMVQEPGNPSHLKNQAIAYHAIGRSNLLAGRPTEALAPAQKSRDILDALVVQYPSVGEYRMELGISHQLLASAQRNLRDWAGARTSITLARDACARISQVDPSHHRVEDLLANVDQLEGLLLVDSGHPGQAVPLLERALLFYKGRVASHPESNQYQGDLAEVGFSLALALFRTGRRLEAIANLQLAAGHHAIAARGDPSGRAFMVRSAIDAQVKIWGMGGLSRANEPSATAPPSRTSRPALYETARTLARRLQGSRFSPPGSDAQGDRRGDRDRAMEALRSAIRGGFRDLELLKSDPDLEPLRSLPEFHLLLMDLAMPPDPFARDN